ncbi:hypothetical protein [Rhodococcus rhodnii]|uniref:hypothetical protein n=1 Tax=Rhodococcus rhodnii TaxID=38312 RepID=UPI001472F578|nr:hypothetical protein [Rhodococcus rhodnii]
MTFSSSADTGLTTEPQTTPRVPTLSTGAETVTNSAHPVISSAMTATTAQQNPNTRAQRLRRRRVHQRVASPSPVPKYATQAHHPNNPSTAYANKSVTIQNTAVSHTVGDLMICRFVSATESSCLTRTDNQRRFDTR